MTEGMSAKAALVRWMVELRAAAPPGLRSERAVERRAGVPKHRLQFAVSVRGGRVPSAETVSALARLWGGDVAVGLALRARAAAEKAGSESTRLTVAGGQSRAIVGELMLRLLELGVEFDPPSEFSVGEEELVLHELEVFARALRRRAEPRARLAARCPHGVLIPLDVVLARALERTRL